MDATSHHDGLLTTYLVERYWPDVTVEAFADAVRRVDASVALEVAAGTPIRILTSTLVPSDEAAYWRVAGPSVEAVERTFARAEVAIERILVALDVGPDDGVAIAVSPPVAEGTP